MKVIKKETETSIQYETLLESAFNSRDVSVVEDPNQILPAETSVIMNLIGEYKVNSEDRKLSVQDFLTKLVMVHKEKLRNDGMEKINAFKEEGKMHRLKIESFI